MVKRRFRAVSQRYTLSGMMVARRHQECLRVCDIGGHKKTRSKAGLLPFVYGLLDAVLQTALERVFVVQSYGLSDLGKLERNVWIYGVIQTTGNEVYPRHN
jgi:hypothetical protein